MIVVVVTPGAKLDVSGGNIRLGDSDNRLEFGTGAIRIQASNSGGNLDFVGGATSASAFQFYSNNLAARIATMDSAGKLRLGDASSPSTTLDVAGSAQFSIT